MSGQAFHAPPSQAMRQYGRLKKGLPTQEGWTPVPAGYELCGSPHRHMWWCQSNAKVSPCPCPNPVLRAWGMFSLPVGCRRLRSGLELMPCLSYLQLPSSVAQEDIGVAALFCSSKETKTRLSPIAGGRTGPLTLATQ